MKVTVPPGIYVSDSETPSLIMKLSDGTKEAEPVQVYCPDCRDGDPAILDFLWDGNAVQSVRGGVDTR